MKKTLLIAGLLLFVIKAYCQPPPTIDPPTLVSALLDNNGDVTLKWIPPANPNGIFDSYHVYSSANISGPFIKIDSIFNYSQTTKTYNGIGQKYFYMTSRDTNNMYSLSSDTLRSLIDDAGVTAIILPQQDTLATGPVSVIILVKNFGHDTLQSIPLSYSVNGTTMSGLNTWTGMLLPGNYSTYTFVTFLNVPNGPFTLCANTNLTYDADHSNDSICWHFYGYSDIEENSFNNNGISISPNPFSHSTQISLNQTYQNIALEVYDIQGKQVAQQQYVNCSQIQLYRNQLTNGLYFVKLTLDNKTMGTMKMVVGE